MKFKRLKILIEIIIILSLTFYQNINGDCECSSNICSDCSTNTNGLHCNDDFICENDLLYLTLDQNASLIYLITNEDNGVENNEGQNVCQLYGKILAEIGSPAYYNYISNLIMNTLVANLISITNPLYIKLNINSNNQYDRLSFMTLPYGQTTFYTTNDCDEENTGLKIVTVGNSSNLQVGCYDSAVFRGILCLSSINSTIIPDMTTVTTSTQISSTTATTSTQISSTNTTTAFDCNSCEKKEIKETCLVTFYFHNNTKSTRLIDCYELDKTEAQKIKEIKQNIEKRKSEQLMKIQEQTKEELKKLDVKYGTLDKVSKSFAFLAYVLIGFFICFITIGDFMKLFKFLFKKIKEDKQNDMKKKFSSKTKKDDCEKDSSQVDSEKLKNLDQRIFEMQVKIKKSLRNEYKESLYNV